jgi:acyl transferase domain-containing protein
LKRAGVKETYPRRATVSSFGAGGANAHIVIEEYSTDAGDTEDNRPQIIILSAKDDGQLKSYAAKLLNAVGKLQALSSSLKSTAYTLQVGRDAMDERLAVIAGSFEELEEKLKGFVEGKNNIHGLFYGQAKRNKDMLTIFAEDEDLQNTVDSWISKGKYEKIAELWAKGLNIDWEKLYVHKKPLRISLPTYPFAGKRYWINTDNLTSADPVTVKLQPEKDEAPRPGKKVTLKDEVYESFEIMTFEKYGKKRRF